MRIVRLLDWLEYDQLARAVELYQLHLHLLETPASFEYAARLRQEIITPNILQIRKKLGLDIDEAYAAAIVEAAILKAKIRQARLEVA